MDCMTICPAPLIQAGCKIPSTNQLKAVLLAEVDSMINGRARPLFDPGELQALRNELGGDREMLGTPTAKLLSSVLDVPVLLVMSNGDDNSTPTHHVFSVFQFGWQPNVSCLSKTLCMLHTRHGKPEENRGHFENLLPQGNLYTRFGNCEGPVEADGTNHVGSLSHSSWIVGCEKVPEEWHRDGDGVLPPSPPAADKSAAAAVNPVGEAPCPCICISILVCHLMMIIIVGVHLITNDCHAHNLPADQAST
jgi:hypothetical protein